MSMGMRKFFYIQCVWLFCCMDSALALYRRAPSIGNVADNLLGPMTGIISVVRAISIIAGIGMVLGSIAKFADYRRNHHEVSLALVITMLLAGICLVLVGFVPFQGM
jgi:hypothetical protein